MLKKQKLDEAVKIQQELIDKYILQGYYVSNDSLFMYKYKSPCIDLPKTVHNIKNEPSQKMYIVKESYDIYDTINTEIDAQAMRQQDKTAIIIEPSQEEMKVLIAQIFKKQLLLDKAVGNVEKVLKLKKDTPVLNKIESLYTFDGYTDNVDSELNKLYRKTLLTMYSLEAEIERLSAKLYPKKALNKRLKLYQSYEEERSSLTLSEYLRLNNNFNGVKIIRVCVVANCYMNKYGVPIGLICKHYSCDGFEVPCDCVYEKNSILEKCECDCLTKLKHTYCPHSTGRLMLSSRLDRLKHLGLLEIDDSAYLAQYEQAKKGNFDNVKFLSRWANGYKHRERIKAIVYDMKRYEE
jgi:hypothetical protein